MYAIRLAVCVLGLFLFCAAPVPAAGFPEKPITYLVPFNPGGESDIIATSQLPYLEKYLGGSVSLTYMAGGGGSVGWGALVRSKADGYTVAGFNLPHIVLQPLQRKSMGYRTADVRPVMIFLSTPNVLAVKADSPYKTLEAFLAAAREKPDMIMIGGSGANTANHLAAVRLNMLAKVRTCYIPFTGTGDAIPAFFAGDVSGLMTYPTVALLHKGAVRVLAVATEERIPGLPDTPTFRELGYNLVESTYRGLAVPPGTPESVVTALYEACRKINLTPEFIAKMTSLGFRMENLGPEAAAELVAEKTALYRNMLEDMRLK